MRASGQKPFPPLPLPGKLIAMSLSNMQRTMTQSPTWRDTLAEEKTKPYFQKTLAFVAQERAEGKNIYPPQHDVFNAFRFTELAAVKVRILGQDPYHGQNQAHGLSFSVRPCVPAPPSLTNIYK